MFNFAALALVYSDSNEALLEKEEMSWWRLTVIQKYTIASTKETIRWSFPGGDGPVFALGSGMTS